MPHDVPVAAFHAQTAEGGLGLPELAVQIPLMRSARVEKLFDRAEQGFDPVLAAIVQTSNVYWLHYLALIKFHSKLKYLNKCHMKQRHNLINLQLQ